MKTFKKYIVGAAALSVAALSLTGCKDKMRELNTNPDIISSALPEYQFLGATLDWGWFNNGWARNRAGDIGAAMQVNVHQSGAGGVYVDPSDWSGGGMGGYYGYFYSRYYAGGGSSSGVRNLHSIVEYIDTQLEPKDQTKYQDIRAISKILQLHEAWTIFANYGAMVYSEAFKVREGIKFPKYDIFSKEIYKDLDDSLKYCINQLNSPMIEDAVALGMHDGFYGASYTTEKLGGAIWAPNTPEKQRERWLKFATTLRVKMALAMRGVDKATYEKVVREVADQVAKNPKSLMSEVQDGCQYLLQYDWYDKNENNQLSFWYTTPLSYINSMKIANDPRLPLVANLNYCDTSLSPSYKFIATYYPDSLKEKNYFDKETGKWEVRSWGDVLKQGNVFQGVTCNPANNGKTFGPGTLLRTMSVSIVLRHPEWKDPNEYGISEAEKKAREEHNSKLKSAKLKNHFTGQVEDVVYDGDNKEPYENGEANLSIRVASGLQSRHYVKNTGGDGWTGPAWDYDDGNPTESKIKMVTKVLPYTEHCFLMALVANYDGINIGGKDAKTWYEEGIRASMQETQEDAERVYVKICTNPDFPVVAGVNADTDGKNKHLYKIYGEGLDVVTPYLVHPEVAFTGSQAEKTNKIMLQMWLALWQKPENTWFYYKVTGFPRTVKYDWNTSTQAAMPKTMGWEQPYNATTGAELLFPRRITTPQPQQENMANWFEMQDKLMKQTNPAYAPGGIWGNNSGRVFWDINEPNGLK